MKKIGKEEYALTDRIYSISEIKRIVAPIALRHRLDRVFLFGSYARGTADSGSDIDLCVDAANVKGMFALGGLYADLEDALGKKLDLVTLNALRAQADTRFLESMQKDGVLIYELSR